MFHLRLDDTSGGVTSTTNYSADSFTDGDTFLGLLAVEALDSVVVVASHNSEEVRFDIVMINSFGGLRSCSLKCELAPRTTSWSAPLSPVHRFAFLSKIGCACLPFIHQIMLYQRDSFNGELFGEGIVKMSDQTKLVSGIIAGIAVLPSKLFVSMAAWDDESIGGIIVLDIECRALTPAPTGENLPLFICVSTFRKS